MEQLDSGKDFKHYIFKFLMIVTLIIVPPMGAFLIIWSDRFGRFGEVTAVVYNILLFSVFTILNNGENGEPTEVVEEPEERERFKERAREEEPVELVVEGGSSWRITYGNSAGVENISGSGRVKKDIVPYGEVLATVQKTGEVSDSEEALRIKLIKEGEVVDQAEVEVLFDLVYLRYSINLDQIEEIEMAENRLDPGNDDSGEGVPNWRDSLPEQYGTITEEEYKSLLEEWTPRLTSVIRWAQEVVKEFEEEELSQDEYFSKLGMLHSEYEGSEDPKAVMLAEFYGPGGIDQVIPPEKYDAQIYYYRAVETLNSAFAGYDSRIGVGVLSRVRSNLESAAGSFYRSYEQTGIEEIKVLAEEVNKLFELVS